MTTDGSYRWTGSLRGIPAFAAASARPSNGCAECDPLRIVRDRGPHGPEMAAATALEGNRR